MSRGSLNAKSPVGLGTLAPNGHCGVMCNFRSGCCRRTWSHGEVHIDGRVASRGGAGCSLIKHPPLQFEKTKGGGPQGRTLTLRLSVQAHAVSAPVAQGAAQMISKVVAGCKGEVLLDHQVQLPTPGNVPR